MQRPRRETSPIHSEKLQRDHNDEVAWSVTPRPQHDGQINSTAVFLARHEKGLRRIRQEMHTMPAFENQQAQQVTIRIIRTTVASISTHKHRFGRAVAAIARLQIHTHMHRSF